MESKAHEFAIKALEQQIKAIEDAYIAGYKAGQLDPIEISDESKVAETKYIDLGFCFYGLYEEEMTWYEAQQINSANLYYFGILKDSKCRSSHYPDWQNLDFGKGGISAKHERLYWIKEQKSESEGYAVLLGGDKIGHGQLTLKALPKTTKLPVLVVKKKAYRLSN